MSVHVRCACVCACCQDDAITIASEDDLAHIVGENGEFERLVPFGLERAHDDFGLFAQITIL